MGGEGAEIPPVHHVDTVPGSDQLDLSKVPGKGSTPVFTRAPKPFSIEDTFMPGSRAGVNMELDPLPAPDNLSESAVQTLDHLKNIAKGVVGQPGPTIERADALETLARLKKSNPSDWERILEDHQSKGENSALREHLLQERAQLKDELEKIANKPVSTPKTAEVPSIIQHKPEIIQHQPAVQVEPVPVPPPAPSIRPETIPPTSQSPDNLPVAESAPSDTTLINFIKQKFGEGNIKSKTIGDKSYLTHTSARGEVTYLKPDGVKMTFDESAGIRLRDGGLTGDGAANIVREAREAKQEATKDLLNDMDDMMQQARGRK